MKIGIILPHLKKFGGVRRYIEFGNAMIQRGVDYTIYTLDDSLDVEWIEFKGKIATSKNLFEDWMDVCICGDAQSLPNLAKVNADVKVVNIIFPMYSKYLLGNYKDYLNDDYLVVGNSTGWYKEEDYKENFYTIPGAVNLSMFQPSVRENDDKFRVLFYAAKQRPWKGVDTILLAKEKLSNPNVIWECFDTERHEDLPPDIIQHVDLPQEEMGFLYSAADAFVSAERLAGWQNCVAEAMACCVPTITTAIGSRDFAEHNRTSIVVPENNPNAIVNGLQMLIKRPPLAKALAKSGYHKIKSLSWSAYAEEWENFLKQHLLRDFGKNIPVASEGAIFTEADFLVPAIESEAVSEAEVSEVIKQTLEEVDKSALAIKTAANKIKKYLGKPLDEKPATVIDNNIALPMGNQGPTKPLEIMGSGSKPFDKYEKMGAYHWTGQDKVYEQHMAYIARLFTALKSMYGLGAVVDIGCGDGYITQMIAGLGFNMTAIDINAKGVDLAKEKLNHLIKEGKVTVEQKDYKDVQFSQYVLASEIIEHLYDPMELVNKIHKDKPEFAIVTSPLKKLDGTMWDKDYHVKEFDPDEFAALFEILANDYQRSLTQLAPYHQYMVLERKDSAVSSYLKSLGVYIVQTVEIGKRKSKALIPADDITLRNMSKSILSTCNNELKRGNDVGKKEA